MHLRPSIRSTGRKFIAAIEVEILERAAPDTVEYAFPSRAGLCTSAGGAGAHGEVQPPFLEICAKSILEAQ